MSYDLCASKLCECDYTYHDIFFLWECMDRGQRWKDWCSRRFRGSIPWRTCALQKLVLSSMWPLEISENRTFQQKSFTCLFLIKVRDHKSFQWMLIEPDQDEIASVHEALSACLFLASILFYSNPRRNVLGPDRPIDAVKYHQSYLVLRNEKIMSFIWMTHWHLGSKKTPQPVTCWFFYHPLGRLRASFRIHHSPWSEMLKVGCMVPCILPLNQSECKIFGSTSTRGNKYAYALPDLSPLYLSSRCPIARHRTIKDIE